MPHLTHNCETIAEVGIEASEHFDGFLGKLFAAAEWFQGWSKFGVDSLVPRAKRINFQRIFSGLREIVQDGKRFRFDRPMKFEAVLYGIIETTQRLEHVVAEICESGVVRNLVPQFHESRKGFVQRVLIGQTPR